MNIYEKIATEGLKIRTFYNDEWTFETASLTENLLYVSGHTPTIEGVPQYIGVTGAEIDIATAQKAGILCLENCLGSMERALKDLNCIKKVVKLNGFVASVAGFSGQAVVMNPVSEKLNAIFGGKHARAAIGVVALPGNVPVEIEMIVEIEKQNK